ncbi:MAG: signal recognition particle protein [Chitinivibrionales bacterium]|nr:signal recognition particle protein [Chitinivibrionales bacterium]
MFEEISGRFDSIFKKLKSRGRLTDENIADAMRDVKRALLEADVNFRVVKKFVSGVEQKAIGTEALRGVSPGQQFVKLVNDELTRLMGGEVKPVKFHTNRLNTIIMAGLQGSGKTTSCAKLALHFRKQGHKPVLVACDIYRAAAIDQLESLGKSLNIPTFADRENTPLEIAREALHYAKNEGYTLAIFDTAGRLHIDEQMMEELGGLCKEIKPDEIFFVADAMTGQDAVNAASEFHKVTNFSGVLLSKMDGDARGGAALSILDVTGVPVRFVGVGEKPDGLEVFHPERTASRILGMGDIVSLVEKAQESFDLDKSRKLEKKLRKNAFTLQDFLDQLHQIKKMGSMGDLLSMIPGVGNRINDAEIDNNALTRIEAIICSMTKQERNKPSIIDGRRKRRISSGSGTTVQEVNRFLKQFDSMKSMMKRMNKISSRQGQSAAIRNLIS